MNIFLLHFCLLPLVEGHSHAILVTVAIAYRVQTAQKLISEFPWGVLQWADLKDKLLEGET